MDPIFLFSAFIFLVVYIFICNEVWKAAKQNDLKAPGSYFIISFFASPVVGLLLIMVRRDIAACKVEVFEETI